MRRARPRNDRRRPPAPSIRRACGRSDNATPSETGIPDTIETYYQYATPARLAAGTRVVMEATHDNSADNIRNPSRPPQRVRWGEQTTDEMSLAFLQVMPVREGDFGRLVTGERGGKLGVIRAADSK
jgi:hypothetical protein